jgi:hypothetical protein
MTTSNAAATKVHRLRRLLADAKASVQIHTIRGISCLMDVETDHPKAIA